MATPGSNRECFDSLSVSELQEYCRERNVPCGSVQKKGHTVRSWFYVSQLGLDCKKSADETAADIKTAIAKKLVS